MTVKGSPFRAPQAFNRRPGLAEGWQKEAIVDFPGGAVVASPPANAGDTGSSPGPGRSHMPRNS